MFKVSRKLQAAVQSGASERADEPFTSHLILMFYAQDEVYSLPHRHAQGWPRLLQRLLQTIAPV